MISFDKDDNGMIIHFEDSLVPEPSGVSKGRKEKSSAPLWWYVWFIRMALSLSLQPSNPKKGNSLINRRGMLRMK